MKKVTIVFDFESQSMDVSVNDARECVTPATTVEEMLANEVFAFRPVKTSHYVVLLFRRICNPPVLIIRICNPINCSLFADGKAQRFERITNPYSIVRWIANHAETQKPPKHKTAETQKRL